MSWPPTTRYEEPVPRKLRTWRCTSDGPFWGAVLALLFSLSLTTYVIATVFLEGRHP